MALYKTLTLNETTKVLIWKIEESFSDLQKDIELTKSSRIRLNSMKSELHQKGFLSIRHLLNIAGYADFDLIYDEIAHKFTPIEEYNTIANVDAKISKLTIVWGAKESLYKIYGKKKLLFLHHIYIDDFKFEDKKTQGAIRFNGEEFYFNIQFLEFEGFTCVFAY